jgi:hypothetical protein
MEAGRVLPQQSRPTAITRVLAACLDAFVDGEGMESIVWEWTLAERLQRLIAIVITGETSTSSWQTRCGRCAVAIEIDVPLPAFVEPLRHGAVTCHSPDGHAITARLPCGNDARAWRTNAADPCAMATMLVDRLDGEAPPAGWRVPRAWLRPLADALAEADPLTVLQLQAGCPNCGHLNVIDFDLEGWLLGLLADEQQHLIDDVHRLARVYHWSEAAICALPHWRRRAYLAQIEREEAV